MIKNIVFDVGNVLVHYTPATFIHRFTDKPEYQEVLLQEIFLSVDWVKYDRGTVSKDQLGRSVCARIPQHLQDMAIEIIDRWHEEIQPNSSIEPVVKALKEQGYQLYILSNAPHAFHQFKQKIAGIEYMSGIFVSAEWKLIKPQKEIYEAFCSHFRLIPSQCFFIDDLPANVEGALNAGMSGCIFKGDVQELVRKLAESGVSLDEKRA